MEIDIAPPATTTFLLNPRQLLRLSHAMASEGTLLDITWKQRLYYFGVLFAVYFAIQRFRLYWRLRQFKGPFSTGISWLWHSRAVISGDSHIYYGEVTEKYGMAGTAGMPA